jgi:hypothetical protein
LLLRTHNKGCRNPAHLLPDKHSGNLFLYISSFHHNLPGTYGTGNLKVKSFIHSHPFNLLDKAKYPLHKRIQGEEKNAMRKTIHLTGVFVVVFLLFISFLPLCSLKISPVAFPALDSTASRFDYCIR